MIKADGPPKLKLEPTPDILAELGASKRPGQVIVGFAAETEDLVAPAQSKLKKKLKLWIKRKLTNLKQLKT